MVPFAVGAFVGLLLLSHHERTLAWLLLTVTIVSLLIGGAEDRRWWTGPRNTSLQSVLRSGGLGASFGLISVANRDVNLKFWAVLVVLVVLVWRDSPSTSSL